MMIRLLTVVALQFLQLTSAYYVEKTVYPIPDLGNSETQVNYLTEFIYDWSQDFNTTIGRVEVWAWGEIQKRKQSLDVLTAEKPIEQNR